ncbi:hypothetical protein, partial [Streptomyces rubiginosohelvolus]
FERQQGFLARRIAEVLRQPEHRSVERHMVFVHDHAAWKEEVVTRLAGIVKQPTELTVVKISNLQDFVARVYKAAEAQGTPKDHSRDAAA